MGMTMVPNRFIDEFMIDASDDQLKVYLYLLRFIDTPGVDIAFESISEALDLTKRKLKQALNYWKKLGLLDYEEDAKGGIANICMNDVNTVGSARDNSAPEEDSSEKTVEVSEEECAPESEEAEPEKTEEKKNSVIIPEYSPEMMSNFLEDSEFIRLRDAVEQYYLPNTMQYKDITTLVEIYDAMGFSPDMVEYIYRYCCETNDETKGSFTNYVKAVATKLAEKEIRRPEQHKRLNFENTLNTVRSILGIQNKFPYQRDEVERWIFEYDFSQNIIIEACNKVVKGEYKRPFNTTKEIIEDWHSKNVKTLEDIRKLDEEHKAESAENARIENASKKYADRSKNRFNDFNQNRMSEEESRKLQARLIKNNDTGITEEEFLKLLGKK